MKSEHLDIDRQSHSTVGTCSWKAAGFRARMVFLAVASLVSLNAPALAQQMSPVVQGVEQAVLIVISPNGIWPAEFTVKPGPFRLEIRNRLGDSLPGLEIETASKQSVRSFVQRSVFKNRDREHTELPVGEYVLRVKGAPDLSCRLIVSPEKK